jgi:hypothetical protein
MLPTIRNEDQNDIRDEHVISKVHPSVEKDGMRNGGRQRAIRTLGIGETRTETTDDGFVEKILSFFYLILRFIQPFLALFKIGKSISFNFIAENISHGNIGLLVYVIFILFHYEFRLRFEEYTLINLFCHSLFSVFIILNIFFNYLMCIFVGPGFVSEVQ